MAGDVAFCAPSCVLAAERKHVAAVATPVCTNVVDRFKAVGNPVVDLVCIVFLYTNILMRGMPDVNRRMPLTPVFDFDIHLVTTFW